MNNRVKFLLYLISFSVVLLWGFGVSAETIFTDNFNSYNLGSLGGQGGWMASPAYIVTDNVVKEGGKALSGHNFNSPTIATKSGALLSNGQITVYVRRADANQPGIFSFKLREGTNTKIEVLGNFGASRRFQYVNSANGSYVNFGEDFEYETWYAVQIQWREVDHSARYNINGGTWTSWVSSIAPWVSGLDTVRLETTNHIKWDTIQEDLIDARTPVLIVPGVIGTEIKNGDEVLWADLDKMFSDVGDNFLDQLSFDVSLQSINSSLNAVDVIGFGTLFGANVLDYSAGLIAELQTHGYIENETLFTFPYDWRYGVTGKYANGKTNTDLLAEKIAQIMQETGSDKVDVVAHSMGGLIAKKYVMDNSANHHIGKAVFVGVPNTGSPEAIKTLLVGDNLGMFFLSQNEIKKIAENMPAMYDLLPSRKYYDAKGSFVTVVDGGRLDDINDQSNTQLNYEEFASYITQDHALNSTALNNATALHTQNFDDFDLRTTGVDVYSINGCKAPTIGTIVEERFENIFGHEFVEYKRPLFTAGDGTVPLESATNLPIDSAKKFYALTGEHGRMMSQDGGRQTIVNILAGTDIVVAGTLITQDITNCQLNGKAISIFSPVNISVTDGQGNYLRLASDESITNEIPNATLEIMGEHKFLFLPTDGNQVYDIQLDGTGEGNYSILIQDIENGETTQSETFSNLPVTSELTGQIQLGVQNTLLIKETPTSEVEIILPSAVFNGVEDVEPPVSTTTLSGIEGQEGLYRSNIVVTISAIDNSSGILSITYSIDGGAPQVVAGSNANFEIPAEGQHVVSFFSTDNAGNNEQEKTIQFTIDKTAPEIILNAPANGAMYLLNQSVIADWTASDALSGIVSVDATQATGSSIDTTSIGTKDFTVVATDRAGNIATLKNFYQVMYAFTDFFTPTIISKTDFKKITTIPIKFTLKDISGNFISTAVAVLTANGLPAISSGGSNAGGVFRYDTANRQYIFNLSAKSLRLGTNTLVVKIDDGFIYTWKILVK